jgi:hypothetical protein
MTRECGAVGGYEHNAPPPSDSLYRHLAQVLETDDLGPPDTRITEAAETTDGDVTASFGSGLAPS